MARTWCALKNAHLTGFPKRQAEVDSHQSRKKRRVGDDVLEHKDSKVSSSVSHVSPNSKASPKMGLLCCDSPNIRSCSNTPLPKDTRPKQDRRLAVAGRQRNKITSWLSKQEAAPLTPTSNHMKSRPPTTPGSSPSLLPAPCSTPNTPEILPATPKRTTEHQQGKRRRRIKKKQAAAQETPSFLAPPADLQKILSYSSNRPSTEDPCHVRRPPSAAQAKMTAGISLELGNCSDSRKPPANRKQNSSKEATSKKQEDGSVL